MNKKLKLEKTVFKDYYSKLSSEEKAKVRDAFLEATDIKYISWYTKVRRGTFSKLEKRELSKICNITF